MCLKNYILSYLKHDKIIKFKYTLKNYINILFYKNKF